MPSVPNLHTNVLLRSEETGGHVSVTEIVVPPHSAGPPLHTHDFDEAFYMLEGELIFQVEDALVDQGRGRALLRPAQRSPHAGQSQRRARALRARLHARGLRAPLGAHRRRGGRGRAAAVGAAADPRGHGRRPADRARVIALWKNGVMSAYRAQAHLDAPLEDVWALVGNPSTYPEWWPAAVEIRGQAFEVGDVYTQVLEIAGRRLEYRGSSTVATSSRS